MRRNPIAARRWEMRGLVQGVAALALAILGEGVLYNHASGKAVDVTVVALLFTIASVLIYRAFSRLPLTEPSLQARQTVVDWHFRSFFAQVGSAWPFAFASAGANLAALVLFAIGIQLNLAWLLYVASVIGGIATVYRLDPVGRRYLSLKLPRTELLALIGILLTAAFFRFYLIGSLPVGLWFDEAQQGLASQRILSDPGFRPVWLTGLSPDPALRMYWQAFFFTLFGPTQFALRLIPALGGMLGVLAAYLLARELFGWRTGLVASALLAVSSWHVDFSRIDLSEVWSVGFDALAAFFLVRALRTRSYCDYALAGLCLGIGINSYWSSYLFCAAIAVYILRRLAFGGREFFRASLAGLIVLAAIFVLTISPLAEFAISHPSEYESRVSQVSLFKEIEQSHSLAPLEHNIVAHVLMFNYQGDTNGRHNLSNWPELDQITGGIFVLGLIVCLRFWRNPNYTLPLLSLAFILLGGILSVDFEAPQSARTIDNSLNSALIAAIPNGFLWSRMAELGLGRIALPFPRRSLFLSTGALLTIVLLAWVAETNYYRYFVLQAHANPSYAAYSIAPTLLGQTMRRLGSGYDVYMSEPFVDQPSINFLSPQVKVENPFDPATTLPLRGHRGAAFFFDEDDAQYFDAVRRFYPSAIFREDRLSPTDPVVLYSAIVPPSQVEALHGLDGSFAVGSTADAPTRLRQVGQAIDFDWSRQAPLPMPFVAKWKGVLMAPVFGRYGLRMEAPPNAILKIDEQDVFRGTAHALLSLAQGRHDIELSAPVGAPGRLRLWWSVPGKSEEIVPADYLFHSPADSLGLLGRFYTNATWSGEPSFERIDVSVIQNYHFLPLRQPFSVSWTGKIDIPSAGLYRFGTQSIDYSWLYIDGRLIVDNSHGENQYVEGTARLSAGLHDILIKYLNSSGYSYISEYWQPPGLPRERLPASRLFP